MVTRRVDLWFMINLMLSKKDYWVKSNCVLCSSTELDTLLDLGETPLANELNRIENRNITQKKYPLILGICRICKHIQLLSMVNPKLFFTKYPYLSNINKTSALRYQILSKNLNKRYRNLSSNFILEIGSNDGSLGLEFRDLGWNFLGVDPSITAYKIATQSGVETICDYFSHKLALNILNQYGIPNLIVANNVLAHSDSLQDIFRGIRLLMNKETVLIIEFSYGFNVFNNFLFDTIYHEHTSYHTIFSLIPFLEKNEMKIVLAEPFDAHGGSLRLHIMLNVGHTDSNVKVNSLLQIEINSGINELSTWKKYFERITNSGSELQQLLQQIKEQDFQIVGYGCPAKFSTLFHFYKLDESLFSFIVDDNIQKQGCYAPGTKIRIKSPEVLIKDSVDFIVIFSWNYAKEIKEKLISSKSVKLGFIQPLPELMIDYVN